LFDKIAHIVCCVLQTSSGCIVSLDFSRSRYCHVPIVWTRQQWFHRQFRCYCNLVVCGLLDSEEHNWETTGRLTMVELCGRRRH